MLEEQKNIDILLEKVQSTSKILHIPELEQEKKQLEIAMESPGFWLDQEKATEQSKRLSSLKQDIEVWQNMEHNLQSLRDLCVELEQHPDSSLQKEIQDQIRLLEKQFEKLEFFLLFSGKHDQKNALVSIYAGSGGTEAQDWSQMLMRMVFRFCEKKGWKVTLLEETLGGEAGIKSCSFRVEGRYAYGHLQAEHGTHRLVRISPFDAESMRHTSFSMVEVIPEMDAQDQVTIDPKDLRIDTFMAGGKGGQSVNTTYSAVRIVHLPTGITVQCQNERSQLQNRETALKVLNSKLVKLQEEKEEKERLELRGEYKSADWGNQIRSYVLHPYKMVKDIRTRHESKNPDEVLDGNLDEFIEEYLRWKKDGKPNRRTADENE